ncbi:MAG: N-acetylneuraminate synthase family protein [Methylomonas sp.]|nr:N-acetylneuraminate synthase family protein [Methylomonas sp.]
MKFNKNIRINDSVISSESNTFIIAEAGVNHDGDIAKAKRMVDAAFLAGADAVKFQSFKTEKLILKDVAKAAYQKATGLKETQYSMLKKLEIDIAGMREIKSYCEKLGIIFITTPFDEYSLDELDELDLPAYKVASTDLTNIPFLARVSKKSKPIILSTGMSYLSEIEMALAVIYENNKDVILLQCSANYPIADNEANLAVINTFKRNFDVLVGYSDHTMGIGAAPFAIPMGAKLVEKHFTLDKNAVGPDHRASLSPDELVEFVKVVRRVDSYIGCEIKYPIFSELNTRATLQKSLVAGISIRAGESFTEENVTAKRCGGVGISPIYFRDVIGKTASRDFEVDEIIDL